MRRFITAPCAGLVVGAIEGGIVFTILAIIDVQRGRMASADIYLDTELGIIYGGFVGAVIGLFVALRNAGGGGGLVIGSLAGAALAIYIVSGTSKFDEFMRTLAVIVPSCRTVNGAFSRGFDKAMRFT